MSEGGLFQQFIVSISVPYTFEESLTEAQLITFHKLLDCVSDTAAAEMRAAYKVGFKDGVRIMVEANS